jgi:hypothetical protein
MAPGRIEFVILRTGRSPPAALHPASRRRSCSRLQAGECLPGEDFHLPVRVRFQAHGSQASRLHERCKREKRSHSSTQVGSIGSNGHLT